MFELISNHKMKWSADQGLTCILTKTEFGRFVTVAWLCHGLAKDFGKSMHGRQKNGCVFFKQKKKKSEGVIIMQEMSEVGV